VGGLTPTTNSTAPIRQALQDSLKEVSGRGRYRVLEDRDDTLIFTLDAHFRSYQLRGRRQLRVIPD
jgi:hypothetical protein